MLAKSKAFSGSAVQDIEQAKHFYGETLGLDAKGRWIATEVPLPAPSTANALAKRSTSPCRRA